MGLFCKNNKTQPQSKNQSYMNRDMVSESLIDNLRHNFVMCNGNEYIKEECRKNGGIILIARRAGSNSIHKILLFIFNEQNDRLYSLSFDNNYSFKKDSLFKENNVVGNINMLINSLYDIR